MSGPGPGLFGLPGIQDPTSPFALSPLGMEAGAPPPKKPGLLERLLPIPSGYAGLMSDEDQHSARMAALQTMASSLLESSGRHIGPSPTFGQSIGRAIGAGYPALDQSVQNMTGATVAGRQAAEQQRILGLRQKIAQMYPATPGETQEQMLMRISNMATAYAANGDSDTASKLAAVGRDLRMARGGQFGTPQQVREGGNIGTFDPSHRDETGSPTPFFNPTTKKWEASVPVTQSEFQTNSLAQKRSSMIASQSNSERAAGTRVAGLFEKTTTPYRTIVPIVDRAMTALDQLQSGNPAAREAALGTFVQALDPKAQMRAQMFQILSDVNPSLLGKARILMNRLDQGTLPPEEINNMRQILQATQAGIKKIYARQYHSTMAKTPEAGPYIDDPDTAFGPGGQQQAPVSGSGNPLLDQE